MDSEAFDRWKNGGLVDLHLDILLLRYYLDKDVTEDLGRPREGALNCHADLPRLRQAGFGGGVLGVHYFGRRRLGRNYLNLLKKYLQSTLFRKIPGYESNDSWRDITVQINEAYEWSRSTDKVTIAGSPEEMEEGLKGGDLTFAFGLEGAHQLGGELRNVEILGTLGFAYVTIVHLFENSFAAAPMSVRKSKRKSYDQEKGLTTKGKQLIEVLYENGVIPDVAHLTSRGVADALEIAGDRPLLCSHTGMRSQYPDEARFRNITDEHAVEIAKRGGVIGIFVARQFLGENADASTFAAHFVHLLKTLSEASLDPWDHVSFGTDYDGYIKVPKGQRDVLDFWINIEAVEKILPEGETFQITGERIQKACHGNFLRLWAEIKKDESAGAFSARR